MNKEFNYLSAFINEIMVVCPNCKSKATVKSKPENRADTRLICTVCGLSKNWKGNASVYCYSHKWDEIDGILMGQPVDCYFKLPLWYTIDIKGNTLFAYNLEHLQFLRDFVEDKLRERRQNEYGWSNQSLGSRLPKWLQSAKNRNVIIKKIDELKNK